MNVMFADDYIIVIDKSPDCIVHSATGWSGSVVVDELKKMGYTIKTSGDTNRMGVVQRLDYGTSGVIVIARCEYAFINLQNQFKNRNVKKKYTSLLNGIINPKAGIINVPIARKTGTKQFSVSKNGRQAITEYKTIKNIGKTSLVEVNLYTGRTHQIRVHFSSFGYPVVGDKLYNKNLAFANKIGLKRQFLHSSFLEFIHPKTNKTVSFNSPLPEDLQSALNML